MREGWEEKLLEEVAYLAGRIGWKGLTAKEYTEEGPYFLSVHSLNYGDYVDFRDAYHISQYRYAESPEIMLQPDDILICKDGAGIGKLGIVSKIPGPSTVNSSLLLIRANEGVLPKYLYYKLCSPYFQRIVQSRIEGAATPHLYQKDIKKFPLFIPSIKEQKRIVAILDEAFAGIDTAIANTKKNLANARELFESYLNSVFRRSNKDWGESKFGDVCNFVRGPFGGSLKKSCFVSEGYAVYEQQHAINDQFTSIRYFVDENKFYEMSRFELLPGDLIMSCSGTMGKVAIVPNGIKKGIINQALLKLTPSNNFDAQFLKLWMESETFIDEIEKYSQGAAIKNVASVKMLKEISVPSPELSQQKIIVEKLLDYRSKTNGLERIYQQKFNSLKELKRSLLQKAFSGELTAEGDKLMDEAVA